MKTRPRTLEGESAIVTVSTSGIGLGAVRALAAESANVVLNGFGDAREIEALRHRLASEYRVNVVQPSHAFATPEQIGALAVFLCSEAAAQIRGAALPIDGGWVAQ